MRRGWTAFTGKRGARQSHERSIVPRPKDALPKVPDGFTVEVFASGFKMPRTLRVAPNGDVFLSETGAGRVLVFRAGSAGANAKPEVFAQNLERPYGVAFVPPAAPRYVYVAAANQVVRYPYDGTARPAGPAEVIVDKIPTERHFTHDGERLFLSVGSASNLAGAMAGKPPRRGGHGLPETSSGLRVPAAANALQLSRGRTVSTRTTNAWNSFM